MSAHPKRSGTSLGRVWTVAQRELRTFFDHPTGYVLLVVLLAANAFLFFRQAYLMGQASLRPMLQLLPWITLFFVPAVTMRSLAEDNRSGLLEVVLTQPITELELVFGKYLGAVLFLWSALALTLPIPLGLTIGADMQWGTTIAQYVGAALLFAGLAGVGLWASSLTRSQITAFILAVAVTFVLILLGLDPLIVGLPPALGAVAARLGVLSHFENIARGVIDLRDAIYFLSLAGVFLFLAYGAVAGRKLAPRGAAAKRLRLGVAMLVATLVIVNLLGGYIGGRLDLTPGNAYTLSKGTKQIVGSLDDLVTIKLFATDELPTEAALLKRDVDDLLRDLRSAGKGKVRVISRNPADDPAAKSDAQSLGIEPVQFNVIGQSELQVKEGYLGIAVQYGSGNEVIPFVSGSDDLEYRIASAIRSLTRTTKPVVGLVNSLGPGEGNVQGFRQQLAKSYDVRDVSLADSAQPDAKVTALAFIGTPDSLPAGATQRLDAFFKRGGGALVLASGMQLSPQMPMATPRPVALNAALQRFGVAINSDMAYDLVANEVVPAQTRGPFQVLQRYPFFIRAKSTRGSTVNRDVSQLFMPWPSTIDTSKAAKGTVTPLILTSKSAGVATGETMIEPSRDFPDSALAPRVLGVQVASPAGKDSVRGRLIVIGSPLLATDEFTRSVPENLAFALNAVDWLAQDEALISIRSVERRPPALAFTSDAAREGVKYFNMIGVPALVALFGLMHLARRRRKTREPYRPLAAGLEAA